MGNSLLTIPHLPITINLQEGIRTRYHDNGTKHIVQYSN